MNEPQIKLAYATPRAAPAKMTAWVFALLTVIAPYTGCATIWFLGRFSQIRGAGRVWHILITAFTAGSLVSVACGWIGRWCALKSGARYAGWASLIGMAIGVVLLMMFGTLFTISVVLPFLGIRW